MESKTTRIKELLEMGAFTDVEMEKILLKTL